MIVGRGRLALLRAVGAVAAVTSTLGACGEKQAPPPPPTSLAASPGSAGPWLRPTTSGEGPRTVAEASLPPGHPPTSGAADASASVTGTVRLDASLSSRPQPKDAVLFIIARDAERKIVAVRREDGVAFPFAFTISSADAMTQGTRFAGPLEITARLSRTGDALPAAGDLEGVASGVAVGARDIALTIDRVRQ